MPAAPPLITLRTVTIFALAAAALFLGTLYVLFQARLLIIGPVVTLAEMPIGHNERVVMLSGTAENITRLWLNDRQIFTDHAGHFRETLVLENGYTVATVRAEDIYGRVVSVSRPFVYIPASFIP
jgi:hypothetical protein